MDAILTGGAVTVGFVRPSLIIDDERRVQRLIQLGLGDRLEVVVGNDGRVVTACHSLLPSVVVLDLLKEEREEHGTSQGHQRPQ